MLAAFIKRQNNKMASKKIKTLSFFFIAATLIASCTMTSTKTKNPTFGKSTASLEADLNKIVSCEGINLQGKEITTNGKITSEVEIDITNGRNIPTDENQMNDLGKQIAVVISALQDKNEYGTYKVLFITKKSAGSVTQRNWIGKFLNPKIVKPQPTKAS
jgi:hypothetical protein